MELTCNKGRWLSISTFPRFGKLFAPYRSKRTIRLKGCCNQFRDEQRCAQYEIIESITTPRSRKCRWTLLIYWACSAKCRLQREKPSQCRLQRKELERGRLQLQEIEGCRLQREELGRCRLQRAELERCRLQLGEIEAKVNAKTICSSAAISACKKKQSGNSHWAC